MYRFLANRQMIRHLDEFSIYLLLMLERMKLGIPDLGRYFDPSLPLQITREFTKLDDKEPCPCGSGKLYGECHKAMPHTTIAVTNPSHLSLNVIPEPDPNTRTVYKKIQGTGTIFFKQPSRTLLI